MAVGKVSDADFEAEVLKATGPVVVDFWAEWCGPCRMIAPALDEISGTMGDKVKIVKLNVDESPKTASKYGVMSIPTLMIFKGGAHQFGKIAGEILAGLGTEVDLLALAGQQATKAIPFRLVLPFGPARDRIDRACLHGRQRRRTPASLAGRRA